MTEVETSCLDEQILCDLVRAQLSEAEAVAAEGHIDACASCRVLLAELLRQHTPAAAGTAEATPTANSLMPQALYPQAPSMLAPGTNVGRFVIRRKLGAGGMGVVYVAHDPKLGREVALKLVRRHRAPALVAPGGHIDRAQLRLLREAQAMAKLSHPNVRAIYEVGEAQDQIFIAMELVHGVSAREYLREAPRSWSEILTLFLQAGQGLAAAHDAGLLHRDFKPENILVSHDGRVLITDFGLARTEGAGSTDGAQAAHSADPASQPAAWSALPLTGSRDAVGTPGYMAPEQLSGDPTDARADAWSFCVALYEALYGKRPFPDAAPADTNRERLLQLTAGPLVPRGRAVPSWIWPVLKKGLSAAPHERFATMRLLLDALDPKQRHTQSRRRLLQGATVTVLTALVGAVGYVALLRPEHLCVADAQRRADAAWSPQRESLAKHAFEALRLPYTADVLVRLSAVLQQYRERWVGDATALCLNTWPRRALPESTLSARGHCLDMRLRELSALTSQLLVPDAITAERALAAAAALGNTQDCQHSDPAMHQLHSMAAQEQQKIDAMYEALAQAQALQRTGHFTQGLQQIEQVHATAQALSYRPLWADVQLLRGGLLFDAGNLPAAATALQDAVLAGEAGHHDEAVARAWIKLVEIGGRGVSLGEAEKWHQHASAALERIGGNLALSAALESNLAHLRLTQGRRAEALTHQEQAVALLEQVGTHTTLERAKMQSSLGAIKSTLGQHLEAIASHQRAIAAFEKELGPSHPMLANALLNLGAALGGMDDTAGEIATYQRVISIWEAALGPEHGNLGVVHHNLGTALKVQGRTAEALPHFQQALTIKQKRLPADHQSTGSTQYSLGATLHRLGRSGAGLRAVQEALRIFEKQPSPSAPLCARALTEIGLIHLDEGRPVEAIAALDRAAHLGSDEDFDPAERGETRFGLAQALTRPSQQQNLARARKLAQQALKDYEGTAYEKERRDINAWLAIH